MDRSISRRLSFPFALAIAAAMAVLAQAQTLTGPIAKTGACPELKRDSMDFNIQSYFTNQYPNTIQHEIPPEQSVNCAQVPHDLSFRMWASEKHAGNIKAIQAFAFDERGRVWAVETFDYPNTLTDPFAGHDRIVILEDTDKDGAVDKLTEFVTGLNIPQGIELVPQGVVIAMPPYIVLFEDKDGDDKADDPKGKILYRGFNKVKPGDTHGGIGNLRYGMDNWLYASSGYNGGIISGLGSQAPFSVVSGIFRVKLDGSAIEQVSKTTANTWGTGFMEDGEVFGSCANGCGHTQHTPIPGQYSVRISTYGEKIMALTQDVVQNGLTNPPGGFTASTDHEIYGARLLPQRYWDRAALVCEGTGHLVNLGWLQPNGSTWKAVRDSSEPNFFASTDAWTAPIMSRTGPDGAVWILDWHNYLFLHNGVGPTGDGGAYRSPLRTKTGCRLYRILPADGHSDPIPDLRNASFEQLVATLGSPNYFWRITAQKLLIRKAATAADKAKVGALLADVLAKSRGKDAVDNDPQAVHALWTAQGLGLFESDAAKWEAILKTLLLHPASGARMNALRALPRTAASAQAIKDQGRVNDPDPQVRLQALLALSHMPKTAGIQMYAPYHNLDAYSKTAFSLADSGTGIQETPTLPPLPSLLPVALGAPSPTMGPIGELRFRRTAQGGWRVQQQGGLPAGTLSLYSLQGRLLGLAQYDGQAWSSLDLPADARLYRFRSRAGGESQGFLAP